MNSADFWTSVKNIIDDGFTSEGLQKLDYYAELFIRGRLVYKRFSSQEQHGCSAGGAVHVIASLLAGAENCPDSELEGREEFKIIVEQPVELSKDFDAVYQRVKSSLFKSDVQERNDKELVNAVAKIKALMKANILPKDYLCDLITVIKADALSGYEIRSINQLTLKDAASLPQKITTEYIARIVSSQNKVDDGEETLIMSEELQ